MRPSPRSLLAPLLVVAALASGCLPDQVDGRQERVAAQPAVDLSWFEETSAPDILDAGLVAMALIGSVRLRQDADNPLLGRGAGEVEGDPIVSKDLLLATGAGIGDAVDGDCTGTLQLPSWGRPAELVVQDDLGAFRGDADFWSDFGGDLGDLPDVRARLADTYADEWTTTPGLASLCTLTDFLAPVTAAAGDPKAVKAGLGDVAGVPAGRVVVKRRKTTLTTWVQIAEPHLVLRIEAERRGKKVDGTEATITTFSDVDSVVDVDFPAPDEIVSFQLPSGSETDVSTEE